MRRWWERLEERLTELGWTKAELSRRSGISYDNINKYLRGEVENPRGQTPRLLADAVDVSVEYLMFGLESHSVRNKIDSDQFLSIRRAPLLSLKQMGKMKVGADVGAIWDGKRSIPVNGDVGNRVFGVKITDASMEPHYDVGDVVIVDPDENPIPGKFVGAVIHNLDEAIIRKFMQPTLEKQILVPLNRAFPEIELREDQNDFILGRVVKLLRDQ